MHCLAEIDRLWRAVGNVVALLAEPTRLAEWTEPIALAPLDVGVRCRGQPDHSSAWQSHQVPLSGTSNPVRTLGKSFRSDCPRLMAIRQWRRCSEGISAPRSVPD